MYWLQSPPYLRRIAATCLVVWALLFDLRSDRTEPYPTAARSIAAGASITSDDISWVAVPVGTFEIPDLTGAITARSVRKGEPITAGALSTGSPAPADWWTVPVAIGELASPGDEVMLVVIEPPLTTIGIVVTPQTGDRYSLDFRPASVAVPPGSAAPIAAAERSGTLVTAARTTPSRQ